MSNTVIYFNQPFTEITKLKLKFSKDLFTKELKQLINFNNNDF